MPGSEEARRMTSLPARGAWIEIDGSKSDRSGAWSLPARGAWIEITVGVGRSMENGSLPARGAWIEILDRIVDPLGDDVAPREGSVD